MAKVCYDLYLYRLPDIVEPIIVLSTLAVPTLHTSQHNISLLGGAIKKNQARSFRNFMVTHSSHVGTGSPL